MADSRAPGYLTPIGPLALYDDELLDFLQPIILGVSGYPDPTLVRPGWQAPDVPNQPETAVDWCAFRVAEMREDTFHYEGHVDSGDGYDLVESSEEIDVLISCYGPRSQSFARVLKQGFWLDQNRAPLLAVRMDVLYVSNPVTLPALLHGKWLRRVDLKVTLRRYLSTKYGVLTLLRGPGAGLDNELYITPIRVEEPAP